MCKHRRRRTFKYGSVKVSALLLFNLWKVHLISASEEPKMLFFQFTRAISSKANQYHHSLAPSLGPKKDRKKVKTFSPKSSTLVKLSFFFFVSTSSPKLVEEKKGEKRRRFPREIILQGNDALKLGPLVHYFSIYSTYPISYRPFPFSPLFCSLKKEQ